MLPLRIAESFRTKRVVFTTVAEDGQRALLPRSLRILEQRYKAGPLEVCRQFETCQFADGWHQIDQFDDLVADRTGGRQSRHADDHRHPRGLLEQRVLRPMPVFAQVESVVGEEDHDRVVGQAQFVQRVEYEPKLRIEERDAGVVGRNRLAGLARCRLARHEDVSAAAEADRNVRHAAIPVSRGLRHRNLGPGRTCRCTSSGRSAECGGGRANR